ncbi:peptidoglycan glycosyltransferase [Thermosipho melanesiensis]|uniref:Peptidoglycan glycosyltransferase n=1 Tax=Thermosipho melanesiensis TaxID=46541 RepID=A0ABM6GG86_9BACT|nr:peptidoglycan glycosyltransferase [Thermosipho melanesiensis]OOC35347.1 peptidoglycan glycosyltransferase [Thermosipho melanesiensis]OOC35564.1 peptidoglycan glycosyltransferase [Thermosipho melanesiensis]OOC36815.1 peptidoglycan glycosyltransferase [Thermosipho melanesiensis]OOC40273.1 peptidoglycan glycosyltransferase [Thermosipho melanesiensis]
MYSLLLLLILIETINILKINSSETDNTLEIKIPSLRGSIYDCNDNLIATSVPHYVAYLDVDFLNRFYNPSMEIDLKLLESRFNIKIDREKRFIKIGEANDIDEIRNRIPTNLRKFVNISIVQKRISLSDFGMDLIIGNIHNQNYSGIEKVFNEYLKEKSDGKIVFKFSGNISKKGNITNIIPPKNGNNLKLTIDSLLQKKLYELAFKEKEKYNAESVGIILMETKTAKIKSLVTTNTWPDYTMGYIEPGSALKPIFYAAALDLNVTTKDATFICNGYIYPETDLDIKITDIHPHGLIDLKKAISESCNVAAVKTSKILVENYGQEILYNIFKTFHFGEPTGIELPGEIGGILKSPENWSKVDWAYLPIGYSIGVTPIQLISAFNSIINDGIYISPTIVENSTQKKYRVITIKTSKLMRNFLKDVVENGTGKHAKVPGIEIFGKTGTSEIKPNSGKYLMTFVGSFKINDLMYTGLIWVRNPTGYYLSSEVAAPIFRELIKTVIEYIKKEENSIYVTPGVVPNVKGWNLRQLLELKKYFNITFVGKGLYAEKQIPNPGILSDKFTIYLK